MWKRQRARLSLLSSARHITAQQEPHCAPPQPVSSRPLRRCIRAGACVLLVLCWLSAGSLFTATGFQWLHATLLSNRLAGSAAPLRCWGCCARAHLGWRSPLQCLAPFLHPPCFPFLRFSSIIRLSFPSGSLCKCLLYGVCGNRRERGMCVSAGTGRVQLGGQAHLIHAYNYVLRSCLGQCHKPGCITEGRTGHWRVNRQMLESMARVGATARCCLPVFPAGSVPPPLRYRPSVLGAACTWMRGGGREVGGMSTDALPCRLNTSPLLQHVSPPRGAYNSRRSYLH